jgi:hypothetical protein
VDCFWPRCYAGRMPLRSILLCLTILCVACPDGSAQQARNPQLQLSVSNYGRHFVYSVAHPESVREAWIEVLDWPMLLGKKSVPVQANGTLDWEWDRSPLNFYEQPEDNLELSIWDPNGETIICDINGVMTTHPGGLVSSTTVGARERLAPYPRLNPLFVRAAQGGEAITFDVTGDDLGPGTRFQVHAPRGGRCDNRSMHAEVLDFAHARVTLAADCLLRPGILLVSADGDEERAASVHVASRTSPVLLRVSPSHIPENMRQDQLRLVLRGTGFTEESRIYAGYNPDAGDYSTDQLSLETEYVSPTELRVRVYANQAGDDTVGAKVLSGDSLRIWVKGKEEKFQLSEPYDVTLRPVVTHDISLPLEGFVLRPLRPTTAVVTSVSPFPIKLMNDRSPGELRVTIHGENFVPEDKVRFSFGGQTTNDREVRSEYVSATLLRAWIPRQLWRNHQLSYLLVVEAKSGKRYVQQVDDTGDNE